MTPYDTENTLEYIGMFLIAFILIILFVRWFIPLTDEQKTDSEIWQFENKQNIQRCKDTGGVPVNNNLYGQLTNCIYLK